MPTPTNTICPLCQGKIEIDYILLGSPMACPHCHQQTTPMVPLGGTIPMSGYHLTFRDFSRLLDEKEAHPALTEMLKKWLNVELPIPDPLVVHLQIQANREWQYEVYQLAMNLWR